MKVRRVVVPVVCLLASISAAIAQPRVDPRNMYERVIVIVAMVGSGTDTDPRRPEYTPVIANMAAPGTTTATPSGPATALAGSSDLLGFTAVESADGKSALVEFVARNRSVFQNILADTSVQAFLKGRDSRKSAEAAFQKLLPGFSIAHFGAIVP